MNEQDKAILRANHVFLVNNLNLKHEMFKAQLIQAELLSSNDFERLEASGDFVVWFMCSYLSTVFLSISISQPIVLNSCSEVLTGKEKKVKFSHTRYRALGPELIPVYRQSARRWREVNHAIYPAVGCRYFLPGLQLPP